jgi:hypothetical protein
MGLMSLESIPKGIGPSINRCLALVESNRLSLMHANNRLQVPSSKVVNE